MTVAVMVAAIAGILVGWIISSLFNINLAIAAIAGLLVFVAIVLKMASKIGLKMIQSNNSEPPAQK